MSAKETVTAQDFVESLRKLDQLGYYSAENNDVHIDGVFSKSELETFLSQFRQQAFSEGRKAGLKEMDEAMVELHKYEEVSNHGGIWYGKHEPGDIIRLVDKLRAEYSKK